MALRKQTIIILASSLFLSAACHVSNRARVAQFLSGKRAAVFVFLAPDCPLSQSYTLTLNRLHEQFQPKGIGFYGVFSGGAGDKKGMGDFVTKYKVAFAPLPDRDFVLADFFGATKTPEVFAVDAGGTVFYQGAIDNWAPDLGQHRAVVTQQYLFNALNSLLDNRTAQLEKTEAVGCFIERL